MARRPPINSDTDQIEFSFEAPTAPVVPVVPAAPVARVIPPAPVAPVKPVKAAAPVAPKPAVKLSIKPADVKQPTPFEKLLHAELSRIFNLCLRLTQDAAKAEDLAQDVFVRSAELLPSATSDGITPDILTRRAVFLFLKDRRYNRPRKAVVPVPVDANAPPQPAVFELPDTWDGVTDEHRLLLSALGTLDARDRALIVLTDFEGRTYAQVATVLEQSEATVRTRVSAARARLHATARRFLEQKKP